jgi:tetratricopeptide (TPR) repeat protein
LALSFFGKKKDEEQQSPESAGGGTTPDQPNPEKAKKFFSHARTVQETGNDEYGMQLWLSGLRWDTANMEGIEGFFNCAANFMNDPAASKRGVGKDVIKNVSGSSDTDKYLRSLLEFAVKSSDPVAAVRAMEMAAKLKLTEPTTWLGRIAFARANAEGNKNPRRGKDLLIKVSEFFGAVSQFEMSVQSAEAALRLDPSDGELSAHIRNLAASATMNKGGYDKPQQEGSFRQNIRDAAKQRELEEGERISKTEDTIERLIAAAEGELIKRPNDLPTIESLAKRLLERAKPADEERAHQLFITAFDASKQFRFRQSAGDIRIRQTRRKVFDLEKMLESAPANEMVQRMLATQQEDLTRLELDEYTLRVAAYPTDLGMKFEVAKRQFALGKFDESIPLFQECQSDPKNRASVQNYLGQAFHRIHYYEEAIQTFRAALEATGMTPEVHREIRYNLMLALVEQGKAHADIAVAREADKIASSIATEQFNYRDIRARRDEIKKLIASLSTPA